MVTNAKKGNVGHQIKSYDFDTNNIIHDTKKLDHKIKLSFDNIQENYDTHTKSNIYISVQSEGQGEGNETYISKSNYSLLNFDNFNLFISWI